MTEAGADHFCPHGVSVVGVECLAGIELEMGRLCEHEQFIDGVDGYAAYSAQVDSHSNVAEQKERFL